jgi:hypothetical protein
MASFTQRLKVVIDVVSQGATKGLSDFKSEVAQADTFTGKLRAGAKNLGSTLTSFTKSPLGAATAITAVGAAALKSAEKFSALGKEAIDLGKATGLSTEQASRWIAVGDDFGVSADQLAAGIGRIARSLESPKWAEYGIAVTDANGRTRDANDILLDVLAVLSQTPSATERARIGADLLGKGWASLVPIVGKTREEYESMLASVSEGQVITNEEAAQGEKWRLAMDRLGDAFGDLALGAGDAVTSLAPIIDILASLVEKVPEVLDLLGIADTGEENLARFATRLKDVEGATWGTSMAFAELSSGLVENEDMVTQLSTVWDALDLTPAEQQAYLMREALTRLAQTAPEQAAQVVASLEATLQAAYRGDEAARIFAEGWGLTIPVLSELKALVPDVTAANEDGADAADENAEAVKRQRDAFDQANRAMADQLELKRRLYGDERDAIERQRDFNDTQAELYEVMADGESTTRDQVDAIIELSEQFGTLTGASLDSEEGTKRQIYQLDELLKGVEPGSPLYVALSEYIAQLKNIPSNVDTQLRLNVIGAVTTKDGDVIGVRTGERALGGPVQAGAMYQVGEGGKPELLTDAFGRTYLIPGSDGVVTPVGGPAGMAGGGGNVTLNVTVTNPIMSGEQLANELKAYISRNGAGWLTR